MKQYIELWNAKDSWKLLSIEERQNYMAQLGPAIQQMLENGVKIVSWGTNHSNTKLRATYDFFAIWEFPDAEAVQNFEALVEAAGWYNYFEQLNISGDLSTPEVVIAQLINL